MYVILLVLGLFLTLIALLRRSDYLAGVTLFSTVTLGFVWPAYHFFSWATLWLIVTVIALVRAIRSRSTLSRVALIVSADILTMVTLGAGGWTFLFTIIAVVFAFIEGERGTKLWKFLASASVAVATIAILMSGNPVAPHIFGTAAAVEAGNPQQSLVIQPGDLLPDAAKCGTDDRFDRNSMPDTQGRLWSDSVSTPFASTDKDTQFKELTSEICENPTLGDAYAQALGDARIGNFSVLDANPWLHAFLQKTGDKDGLKVWLTHKASDAKTIYVTADYQSNAQLVNALLFALDNQGTQTGPSMVNWPLGALVADNLSRVYKETDAKRQENLPFMALTYTQKNGSCPYVLGVNEKDKRPENVSCETAVKVAPKTPTPPRLTVTPPAGAPTPKTTPSTSGHTPTPTPTPSTPRTCVWKNGSVHELDSHGTCPKENLSPTNPNHTPAASPSGHASSPSHPSQTANPATTPGSGSTQTAPGASAAPKPSESAPPVGNPSSTATRCIPDPDTGKGC